MSNKCTNRQDRQTSKPEMVVSTADPHHADTEQLQVRGEHEM